MRKPWAGDMRRQLLPFAVIGACSTAAHALLFLNLRGSLGGQLANVAALGLTTIANTAANRAWTFGVRGGHRLARDHVQALTVFGACLVAGSLLLALVRVVAGPGHPRVELAVLVLVNMLATVARFALLKLWVFRRARRHPKDLEPPRRSPRATDPGQAVSSQPYSQES